MTNAIPVLYVSYDGMTDPLGQSQVLPYLGGLAKLGYSITLLSCEKPERYAKHKDDIAQICTDAGIDWQPIHYTASPPVLSTIIDVRQLHRKAETLYKSRRFTIIHCRSYISALVGLRLQKVHGCKFVFDMRGFWADERVDGGLWNLDNPLFGLIYRYFKKKEKTYLRKADHIISLTVAAEAEIQSWNLVPGKLLPITVIPCCVDTALFDPAKVSSEQKRLLRETLGVKDDAPLVGYVGSIGTWYLLEEMLFYFKSVLNQKPESRMLFLTGEAKELVLKAAERLGIPSKNILVRQAKRTEVPGYISILDYSIFFIKPSYSKKASSPTKQGEIMAMGKPVVCNASVGDTEKVVTDYK
ncbi:MAG: glycosyltransferase, partial [Sphingobacteriales bacterium]